MNERGAGVPAPAALYYRNGSACVSFGAPSNEYVFYALGPAVDPGRFVAATEVVEPRTAELAVSVLEAEDGARQVVGVVDVARSASCWLAPVGLETGPCVPLTLAYAFDPPFNFADAGCTEPAAYAGETVPSSSVCAEATVVLTFSSADACGTSLDLREVGAEVTAPYDLATGSCFPAAEGNGYRYFELGAPLEASAFPSLGVVDLGGGPVAARWTSVDGAPVAPSASFSAAHFVDVARGVGCSPEATCDGSLRCVPPTAHADASNGPFADAGCTELVASAYVDACHPYVPDVAVLTPASCSNGLDFVALGGAYVGDLFIVDAIGACVVSGSTSDDPATRWFRVGAALPSDALSIVVDRVE